MAVVRVKRRLQDNPIEAIFLKCKKLKLEEGSCTAVFKFAATVKKDDDVAEHIKEVVASSTQHENKPPGPTKNITEKMRAQHSQNSKNNRFKVVNYFRALESQKVKSEDGSAPVGKTLTVVDMEKCSTVGAGETTAELTTPEEGKSGGEQYVYDLYYTYNPDLDDALIERLMSGHGSISDSAFGVSETLDEDDDDSLPFDDEDDSNDENNWRNDYPDEDDFSPDEDDMRLAMRLNKIALDGSDAESSEDEYKVYDDDLELDPSVVQFHGSAYARFKAEFKRKYSSDES